jgi:hypothetical protein
MPVEKRAHVKQISRNHFVHSLCCTRVEIGKDRMMEVAVINQAASLPALVDRAAKALSDARNSAEVLEAGNLASVAYNAAKSAARFAKAKNAAAELISTAHRLQADALEIEARAKRRLADEWDAAQEHGEAATGRDGPGAGVLNGNAKATVKEAGISRKEVFQARQIRDAELADPGIVRRTLDEALAAGEEPTRAKVSRAVRKATTSPAKGKADLRLAAYNELRMRASEARSCAKFPDSKIALLKRCKDFSELVAVARKASNAWTELANRIESFKCPPKKMKAAP